MRTYLMRDTKSDMMRYDTIQNTKIQRILINEMKITWHCCSNQLYTYSALKHSFAVCVYVRMAHLCMCDMLKLKHSACNYISVTNSNGFIMLNE